MRIVHFYINKNANDDAFVSIINFFVFFKCKEIISNLFQSNENWIFHSVDEVSLRQTPNLLFVIFLFVDAEEINQKSICGNEF